MRDILPILVVEDSAEDFDVLEMIMRESGIQNQILRATNGLEALKDLSERQSQKDLMPGLILLDLNLIGIDGKEVLRRLKADAFLMRIPVIVFSTSSSPKDIESCYALGAAAYTVKPVSLEKLEGFVAALKTFWLDQAYLPRENDIDRFRRLNA